LKRSYTKLLTGSFLAAKILMIDGILLMVGFEAAMVWHYYTTIELYPDFAVDR
jgi:hypothetical protein